MTQPPDLTEKRMREAYPFRVDLSNCDVEPLHHIGVIQSATCLLAADLDTLKLRVVSENTVDHLGVAWDQLIDAPLVNAIGQETLDLVQLGIQRGSFEQLNPIRHYVKQGDEEVAYNLIAHLVDGRIVLEAERVNSQFHAVNFQKLLGEAVQRIQGLTDFSTMFEDTARILKAVSGYDRVMVYRFDREFNGEIIAEARNPELESFVNLRYPASDIPAQARELYKRNQVRMLADVHNDQIRLRKSDTLDADEHLDLTLISGRGASPIHQEYLSNMGVQATMSIAIMLNDQLWGLFAMHHYSPRFIDYELRSFMLFVGQVFSGHLALQAASDYRERILDVNVARSKLSDQLSAAPDMVTGLFESTPSLLDIVPNCTGVAVSLEGDLHLKGETPTAAQVSDLVSWISQTSQQPLFYHHDSLCEDYAAAEAYCDITSGALLIWLDRVRREYVIWFRPELIREVNWGGDPKKHQVSTSDGGFRLSPRKSFEKYSELVRNRSQPWTQFDEDAALALRSQLKDVVMQRYHQVRQVNNELSAAYREMEAFSYTISHDLRAPLRGISGYAEILLEDYAEVLDDDGRMMLASIQGNTKKMNVFINELLELSKVGTASLQIEDLQLGRIASDAFEQMRPNFDSRRIELTIEDDLPPIKGDSRMLKILLNNIIGNAIKYTLDEEVAKIEIGRAPDPYNRNRSVFYVRDNGIGFEQKYAERAFEMFSRLTTDSRIEGSGVGLALVQRVIEKHNGAIWTQSEPGQGTTFFFTFDS